MHRRSVLSALGAAAVAAAAGCLGGAPRGESPTATTAPTASTTTADAGEHTVTVTARVEHGTTGLTRVLRAEDGGRVAVEVTCPDGATETASTTVGDDWAAFERRVLAADATAFADRYACEGDCPTDAPPTRLEFDVDGTVTEVVVEPTADRPDDLDAVLDGLDAFAARLDVPACE